MSGYDFLSGFLGNISDQMKEKEARKKALEDEDRQDKRTLSRQEALDASRERLARNAEERKLKNTPPTMRQFIGEDGKRKQVLSKYLDGKYNDEGTPTDVPQAPLGKPYNANGRLMQPMNFGAPIDLGQSDASLNRDASRANNAASIAASRYSSDQSLAASMYSTDHRVQADPEKEIKSWISGGLSSYRTMSDVNKKGFLDSLGLQKGALEPIIRERLAEQARRNQEVPKSPASNGAKTLLDVGKSFFGGASKPSQDKTSDGEPEVTDAELEQEPEFMKFAENLLLNAEQQKRPINNADIRLKYREFYKKK